MTRPQISRRVSDIDDYGRGKLQEGWAIMQKRGPYRHLLGLNVGMAIPQWSFTGFMFAQSIFSAVTEQVCESYIRNQCVAFWKVQERCMCFQLLLTANLGESVLGNLEQQFIQSSLLWEKSQVYVLAQTPTNHATHLPQEALLFLWHVKARFGWGQWCTFFG